MKPSVTVQFKRGASYDLVTQVTNALRPICDVTINLNDFDVLMLQLKPHITHFTHFSFGFVTPKVAEYIKANNIEDFTLRLTHQVTYNGASFTLDFDNGENVYTIDPKNTTVVQDAWSDLLHGEMLEKLNEFTVLMAFGLTPDQSVIDLMKTGEVMFTAFGSKEDQVAVFSDYQAFVDKVMSGTPSDLSWNIEVYVGTDT